MKELFFKIKTYYNNSKTSFAVMVICFGIFLLVYYELMPFRFIAKYKALLIFAIPVIISFSFVNKNNKKGNEKAKKLDISKVILILFLIIFFYYGSTLIIAIEGLANNPEIKTYYYKRYYNSNDYMKNAFPSSIPKSASNVSFKFIPGILMAGTSFVLYYIDSELTIEKLNDLYEEKAEWIGKIDDYNLDNSIRSAFFYTDIEKENENDFLIYLIDSRCDNSGYCNHGNFLLVAFNEKTNEVLYKIESW